MSTSYQTSNPSICWAYETERNGRPMKLVAAWNDILAYYEDENGDIWSVNTSSRWSFATHTLADIGTRLRGHLI